MNHSFYIKSYDILTKFRDFGVEIFLIIFFFFENHEISCLLIIFLLEQMKIKQFFYIFNKIWSRMLFRKHTFWKKCHQQIFIFYDK